MFFIIIFLLLILTYYSLSQLRNSKFAFNIRGINRLRLVHCILASILLFLWILSSANIYLRGFWSTKILIWLFLLSAFVLFVLGNNQVQGKYEKRYFGFFFFLPIILPLLFLINPYGSISLILGISNLVTASESEIYYSDSKYRIEGDNGTTGLSSLYTKKGLYEIRKQFDRGIGGGTIDSTTIIEKNDTLFIHFYYNGQDKLNNYNLYPYVAKVKIPD